jgi:glutamate carboxypeptidase
MIKFTGANMRVRITRITIGLLGFILMLFIFLGHNNRVLAIANSAIYEKAQQAQKSQSGFLTILAKLVDINSGTIKGGDNPEKDWDGLKSVEKIIVEQLQSIGAEIKFENLVDRPKSVGGNILVANPQSNTKPNAGRNIIATVRGTGKVKILILAHTDTVFNQGEVKKHKFHIVGNKAYGLGIMDDKGSILLGIEALRILKELNFKNFETITFLINPDEETGSYGSRDLIQSTARKHDVALVLEFGTPQDTVSLARKGIGSYGFTVKGKTAHAGANPEQGCNALLEAAYQTQQLSKLGNPQKQTTVNFTRFKTGENSRNTIPDYAEVQADVRVLDAKEYDRLDREFDLIKYHQSLACKPEITIQKERGRPPFPENPLIKRAQAIYKTIPITRFQTLGVAVSGGGTDGNYANFAGTSTLDALGLVGGGAHTKDEYIELDRIPARIYLLTKLMMELGSSK